MANIDEMEDHYEAVIFINPDDGGGQVEVV